MRSYMNQKLKQGQKLWFKDKYTNKKATITIESVYKDHFTFFYKNKLFNCPISKIDNGIYIVTNKTKHNLFFMVELFYFEGGWKRYDNKIYSEKYQQRLSKLYIIRQKYCKWSSSELTSHAQKAVENKKFDIAISYYEMAIMISNENEIQEYISSLSSLYRKIKCPNASIELYKYIKYKYENFRFTSSFYTSLSAAYLDIGNKEKSLDFANKVYGISRGDKGDELKNLYYRINSHE